ncbi:TPA: glycosyltransferase family 2 protein [Vibrio parahaemolyticus]|nr:glycosyltransferase family 2 protein [Vibrio parahaemolyticus]HAS6502879.1 glycosyltransferase [Vibrio parahaemolyticus]HCE4545597.1 glycosyltransferase family 2 protein [Vibrio parahaemolyticus]
MTNVHGNIEQFEGGVITGWLFSERKKPVLNLLVDEEIVAKVEAKIYREDVKQAGFGDGYCGFVVDLGGIYQQLIGERVIGLSCDSLLVAEKKVVFPEDENFVLNPFLELDSKNNLKFTEINSGYRNALQLDSYIAPESLTFSNGYYTRVSTLDYVDSGNTITLDFKVKDINIDDDIELSLTARAFNDKALTVKLLNVDGDEFCYEPLLIGQAWAEHKLVVENSSVKGGISAVRLEWRHTGRSFFDLSKLVLARNTDRVNLSDLKCGSKSEHLSENLISNGDFSRWKNGIDFRSLSRGDELADNWYLEYHKNCVNNVSAELYMDSTYRDNHSIESQPRYGISFKTTDLNGYARVVTTLAKSRLIVNDYKLNLTVFSDTRVVIPRIYMLACDGVNDDVVCDVTRKLVVNGKSSFDFELSSFQIETIISKTKGKSIIKLAIDLPSYSNISILNADLRLEFDYETSDSSFDISNVKEFEDECITSQIALLKGLDSWLSKEAIAPAFESSTRANLSEERKSTFTSKISQLVPHKLIQPYRNFPSIDIIIPVYNACDDVLMCLSSLIEKTDLLHRVIVINDGEEPKTAEMLDAFNNTFSHLEVVNNDENMGYTKSVNKGIRLSNANWVVVLNSDTIVSEGWLGRLMNCALSEEQVGMVGALSNAASWQSVPNIHDDKGDWHLNPLPNGMTVDDVASKVAQLSQRAYPQVGVINGFCQLINTEMLDSIGLLDEVAFPVGYGEENDMCARAVKAGYKLIIADDTYVFHSKSKSFGHDKRKVLAKQGSIALKAKHPDVDWASVTKAIYENKDLVALRQQLNEIWTNN